jgi:UDP-N-acetylmuramate--alanine ligase
MSALAQYLSWQGMNISGSDRFIDNKDTAGIKKGLLEAACQLFPQDGSGISTGTDIICVSSAIEDTNPDIVKARSLNIPVVHRSDVLASIIQTRQTIAIAGTSGKSTVTAMIFEFLSACNKSPSLISGASLRRLENDGLIGNAYNGKSELLVVEADESDGTLVKYSPAIGVILNISKDHKPVPEVLELFKTLAKRSACTITNADDPLLSAVHSNHTFGITEAATFHPESIESLPGSGVLVHEGIRYELPLPGLHNLSNCAAAISVCLQLKCDRQMLAASVKKYQGVARRFTVIPTLKGVFVVDDFAHNPEKIKAAVTASRGISKRLTIIYQPHGFGPTRFLKDDYVNTFQKILNTGDTLYLLPIFYAGGTAKKDISSEDIITSLGDVSFTAKSVNSREWLLEEVKRNTSSGECIVLMGARDPSLSSFAQKIAEQFGEFTG